MPDILPLDRRAALTLGAGALLSGIEPALARRIGQSGAPDWASQPMRWFQLAFTEDDPGRYDPAFWIDYFQQIHADGICLSAGGGIAFYPSAIPYHGMAQGIGKGMDPFGDMVATCKKLGVRVLARIDPHAMNAAAAAAHPEWALTGPDGKIKRHGTIRTGPYRVRMQLPRGRQAAQARLLTAATGVPHRAADGWVEVEVPHIDFHEVVAIDLI